MKTSPVCTRTHSHTKHNQLYLTVELFQHLWVVVLLRILMKGNHTISLINACIYIPIFYLERKEKYYLKTSKGFINTLCMYLTHREYHEIWRRAFSLASDWLRVCHEFSKPISKQSYTKRVQSNPVPHYFQQHIDFALCIHCFHKPRLFLEAQCKCGYHVEYVLFGFLGAA